MSNVCPLDYRYGREDMKAVFSEESRIFYQMQVEAALARAHASLGTIPQEAADEITRVASLDVVSVERIKEIEKDTRHDLMAMVKAMTEKCEGDAGKYVHLGATSNDIVDTATALQMKAALEIVMEDVDNFTMTLAKIAKRERDTLEIGRTHAQFAIPITFGFKIAGYIAEMLRHRQRIIDAMPRICAGKMAGAVGTGAALGKNFFEIQKRVMQDLELTYEPAATQVVGRDRYTECICIMANIATSLERYGTEVRNLQRSEIGEASEYFDVKKQVGSSTMAQKRAKSFPPPISSQRSRSERPSSRKRQSTPIIRSIPFEAKLKRATVTRFSPCRSSLKGSSGWYAFARITTGAFAMILGIKKHFAWYAGCSATNFFWHSRLTNISPSTWSK